MYDLKHCIWAEINIWSNKVMNSTSVKYQINITHMRERQSKKIFFFIHGGGRPLKGAGMLTCSCQRLLLIIQWWYINFTRAQFVLQSAKIKVQWWNKPSMMAYVIDMDACSMRENIDKKKLKKIIKAKIINMSWHNCVFRRVFNLQHC